MSNNFAGIASIGFRGATYRLPVKLPQGVVPPPNRVPPSVCPVAVDWNVYWQALSNPQNIAVNVNLQAASVQASILDRIASVKIDNTGSVNPVYVRFNDTGDVINCPPNCTVTFPCLTNLLIADIIILGLTAGFIPTTRVFFYNVDLPPSVDYEINNAVALWKASPTISRGSTIYNSTFGVPALGDQLFTFNVNVGGSGPGVYATNIFNTPFSSGKLTLTSLFCSLQGVQTAGGTGSCGLVIESTGVAGTLTPFGLTLAGAATGDDYSPYFYPCVQMQNCNILLDATQTYQLRMFSQSGSLRAFCAVQASFTEQPNV